MRSLLLFVMAERGLVAHALSSGHGHLSRGGHGRAIVSFSYNSATKVGKLVVKNKSGKSAYRVDRKTDCGVSYGNPPQSGDSIPCRTLGKDKYDNRPVRVTWHRGSGGKRVADLVAVALP